jgi:hypothetical protein
MDTPRVSQLYPNIEVARNFVCRTVAHTIELAILRLTCCENKEKKQEIFLRRRHPSSFVVDVQDQTKREQEYRANFPDGSGPSRYFGMGFTSQKHTW